MKSISVKAEHEYSIHIAGKLDDLQSFIPDDAVWVTTHFLRDLFSEHLRDKQTIVVPDGENQKSFLSLQKLLAEFVQRGLTRSSTVVALGGGATTDLVGFAAAIYMRGIRWIAVPTSLAGMVDAAIGGKTGINSDAGKNLVGSFYSPQSVLIATEFLSTLSDRDLKAGMAEVAKCGFIRDKTILNLSRHDFASSLEELIIRAASVKADVVSQDFKEGDQREILNYGHTLGHAIESHSKYSLRHGEAISIGLLFAAEVSARLGSLSRPEVEEHREVLSALGLPLSYAADAWPDLYATMLRDKKRRSDGVRFVTLKRIGEPDRIDGIKEEELAAIYRDVIGR